MTVEGLGLLHEAQVEGGHDKVLEAHAEDGQYDEQGAAHVRHVGRRVEHSNLNKKGFYLADFQICIGGFSVN